MQKSTICQKEKRLRKSKHPESFHADLRHTSAATMCYAHVCHFRITNSDNEVMFLTTRFYEIQFNYGVSARGKKLEPRAMDIYPYDTTLSHCWDQQNKIKTCYCSPRLIIYWLEHHQRTEEKPSWQCPNLLQRTLLLNVIYAIFDYSNLHLQLAALDDRYMKSKQLPDAQDDGNTSSHDTYSIQLRLKTKLHGCCDLPHWPADAGIKAAVRVLRWYFAYMSFCFSPFIHFLRHHAATFFKETLGQDPRNVSPIYSQHLRIPWE